MELDSRQDACSVVLGGRGQITLAVTAITFDSLAAPADMIKFGVGVSLHKSGLYVGQHLRNVPLNPC